MPLCWSLTTALTNQSDDDTVVVKPVSVFIQLSVVVGVDVSFNLASTMSRLWVPLLCFRARNIKCVDCVTHSMSMYACKITKCSQIKSPLQCKTNGNTRGGYIEADNSNTH